MLLSSSKQMCSSCSMLCHWLAGLTLLVIGVVGLLEQIGIFMTSPWGWIWPVIVIIWGLVALGNVGCKDCK